MKTKIRVLILKGIDEGHYSIFIYFDLFEFLFVVKRKPMKKYPVSFIKKITSTLSSPCKTPTILKNEQDIEKRINNLKSSWPWDPMDCFFIYYEL